VVIPTKIPSTSKYLFYHISQILKLSKPISRFNMDAAKNLISSLDDSNTESSTNTVLINKLIWNQDKSKALFSDVKIVIVPKIDETTKNDNEKASTQQQSYFAHNSVIACGERGSMFFFNAAQAPDFATNNSTIYVKMSPRLTPHFPKLMNYLYDDSFVISSDNAIQLRMFAHILEIPCLQRVVNEFIANDMNPSNAATYLMRIIEVQQDDISDDDQYKAAINECAKNFDIAMSSDITSLDPEILKQIVTDPVFKADSIKYSDALLKYMKVHGDIVKIDNGVFQSLVCCKVMPELSMECSVFMLKNLEFPDNGNDGNREVNRPLKKRCMDSIAHVMYSHPHKHYLLRELSYELQNDFQWSFLERIISTVKYFAPVGIETSSIFIVPSLPDANVGLRVLQSIHYRSHTCTPANLKFRLMGLQNNFRVYKSDCSGYQIVYDDQSTQWEMKTMDGENTVCTVTTDHPPNDMLQRRSWLPPTNGWCSSYRYESITIDQITF